MNHPSARSRRRRSQSSRSPASPDSFWNLVATARRLQGPGGCPWDRAQTVESLVPHLVEEVWEVYCAVRRHRRSDVEEELGDALYTVLFLSLLAERQGWFSLNALLRRSHAKMVRRHPHVFGNKQATTAQEAYAHWKASKRRERRSGVTSTRLRPLLVALFDGLFAHRGSLPAWRRAVEALEDR